jgi:hypothetical protein
MGWSQYQKRVEYLFFVGILGMESILSWSWYCGMRSSGALFDAGARSKTLLNVVERPF